MEVSWAVGEPHEVVSSTPPIIPFSPLDLGQLINGTFAAIRSNPNVMFTISVVTMAVLGVIAGAFAALAGPEIFTSFGISGGNVEVETVATGLSPGMEIAQNLLTLLVAASSLLVSGALVLVVTNAVVGRNLDLNATLDLLKARAWKLIGTAVLVWLIMFGTGLGLVLMAVMFSVGFATIAESLLLLGALYAFGVVFFVSWLSVRLYFATMVAVVEDVGAKEAIRRSWKMTDGAFWRTFGRLAVVTVLVGIFSGLMIGGIGFLLNAMGLSPGVYAFLTVFTTFLVSGVLSPVTAAFSSLMYVDQRMRSEDIGPALKEAWEEAH